MFTWLPRQSRRKFFDVPAAANSAATREALERRSALTRWAKLAWGNAKRSMVGGQRRGR